MVTNERVMLVSHLDANLRPVSQVCFSVPDITDNWPQLVNATGY